jgi:hypothetical protein
MLSVREYSNLLASSAAEANAILSEAALLLSSNKRVSFNPTPYQIQCAFEKGGLQ